MFETDPVETQRTGSAAAAASAVRHEDVFYLRQGEDALNEALEIVESKDGWKLELAEVIIKYQMLFTTVSQTHFTE